MGSSIRVCWPPKPIFSATRIDEVGLWFLGCWAKFDPQRKLLPPLQPWLSQKENTATVVPVNAAATTASRKPRSRTALSAAPLCPRTRSALNAATTWAAPWCSRTTSSLPLRGGLSRFPAVGHGKMLPLRCVSQMSVTSDSVASWN